MIVLDSGFMGVDKGGGMAVLDSGIIGLSKGRQLSWTQGRGDWTGGSGSSLICPRVRLARDGAVGIVGDAVPSPPMP